MNTITPLQKVTAFVTRKRNDQTDLLVFEHPLSGVQQPAGTIDPGEVPETAVVRETVEETGITGVRLIGLLGRIETDLRPNYRALVHPGTVYAQPDANTPNPQPLGRGGVVEYLGETRDFLHILYQENHYKTDPPTVFYEVRGWMPRECLSDHRERFFYHLICIQETSERWTQPGDDGHLFAPFWTPLKRDVGLVDGQIEWLDFVYEALMASVSRVE